MYKFFLIILFCAFIMGTGGCAKRGTITGGAKDTLAPKLIRSVPKNFSTDFKGNEIILYFDEYVKIKDVSKQLIISPPMNTNVEVLPQTASKILTIKIKDTLKANTTYNLNFGESIQDNNEGNSLRQFKYVFSTGNTIDTLSISGSIKDALEKKSDNFVSVMLYELNTTNNDSIVYKQKPRYVTNTLDSLKIWKIDNIKAGKYLLVALKDKNNNFKYNPSSEKIAFHSEPITVPTDSFFDLKLFKEKPAFTAVKATFAAGNKIIVAYKGLEKQSKITLRNGKEKIQTTITKIDQKDSLQVWFPKIKADSLQLEINQGNYNKNFTVKTKTLKVDTLSISANTQGSIKFRDNLELILSTPLSKFDKAKMVLLNKDSIAVKFNVFEDNFNQKLRIDFEKEELQDYKFKIEPSAITDVFGNQNKKAQVFTFSTSATTNYGNMKIKLDNVKTFPLIVQLVDDNGKILAEAYTEKEPFVLFDLIDPATYIIRVIFDENKNKVWDEGNYLLKIQPEKVIYYTKNVPVRANWDVEQPIDVGDK